MLNLCIISSILLFATTVTSQPSPYGFKNQYIQTINNTNFQLNSTNVCHNFWCTYDADYLFKQSSQYSNVDPCVDFKNFTLSNTIEVNQVNDRFTYGGMVALAEGTQIERWRKVLSEKVREEDNKIVKVIKRTFKKCLKSPHTFRHLEAHRDIIEYLTGLGGSPYLSRHVIFNPNRFNASVDYKVDAIPGNVSIADELLWNEEDFDLQRIFNSEPHHAMVVFFQHYVVICKNNNLCLKETNDWGYREVPNFIYNILKEVMENLEDHYLLSPLNRILLKEKVFLPAAAHVDEFMKSRFKIFKEFGQEKVVAIKVGELRNIGKINWLEVINGQLLTHSQVDENDEILIKPNLFKKLVENLELHKKKILADTFVLTMHYSLRHATVLRFFNDQDMIVDGRKKNFQRFETCIKTLKYYVAPAIEVMYELKRPSFDYFRGDFNRNSSDQYDIIKEAEKLVQEALEEMKRRIINGTNFPLTISSAILRKLKTAKVIVGFTNETLSVDELETFYEDLNLNGSESFLKSIIEMRTMSWKIKNEPKGSWRKKIEDLTEIYPTNYDVENGNFIFVPPLWIIYPLYHPQRPRFFNMATLFQFGIWCITNGLVGYAGRKLNYYPPIHDYLIFADSNQVAYESYSKWLENHTELEIGANYLTNKQLYWVAVAVFKYHKYHRIIPKTYAPQGRLQVEYLHVWLKTKPGFQDAFHCELTQDEYLKIYEFAEKLAKLSGENEEDIQKITDDLLNKLKN